MNVPVLILGGGGHTKVLIDALQSAQIPIVGIADSDSSKHGTTILGIAVLGDDSMLPGYPPGTVLLANGLGSVERPTARATLFETKKALGYSFSTVVHRSSIVACDAYLGEGSQIMAGSIVQPGCRIGVNCIINTGAVIDHDCRIDDHVHVAPGATLSGGVRIGRNTHIGTGATIIQGISIGSRCVIAAGAVVINAVPDNAIVMGVPAREVHR